MKKKLYSYKNSGVNISLGNKFVKHVGKLTKKNVKKANLSEIGTFASFYDINHLGIKDPVIVSCTDGVGTKLELSDKYNKLNTIGIDLVAMCVNDLIVQGAKPLFFLDYIAIDKIKFSKLKKILNGILKGCKLAGCSLVGGETAEMPGIYKKNKFDLAGFSSGIVSKKKILKKENVKKGDIILAIPSSGIHSNGYSLVRNILKKNKLPIQIKKNLLNPTKIYVNEILNLNKKKLINSAANITGGGIIENVIRSIPENLTANIDLSKIKVQKIFSWLKSKNISDKEMLRTFNCGVGFCIITKRENFKKIKRYFSKQFYPYEIGYISKNSKRLNLYNKIKW
ncbi:MAG: phosphoribosylformylglycinamidine cyclo-ligase [Candidatus Pelagibacter sp.]|nr:phosphoribosylformylglycinamidine cyclo-ligase [Candidatus Pelagibacter sp.]OUW68441.1 MAG: phosphoribosylformylglycinamidine cyclo-ligase [Candidatus Pelagibacter sp. TMED202]|tara:strand:- start:10347 stop:11363 length:1017 start_codon:yes stop_codon:yes gene_type:complete